jgi:hypothetical protein
VVEHDEGLKEVSLVYIYSLITFEEGRITLVVVDHRKLLAEALVFEAVVSQMAGARMLFHSELHRLKLPAMSLTEVARNYLCILEYHQPFQKLRNFAIFAAILHQRGARIFAYDLAPFPTWEGFHTILELKRKRM